MLLLRVAVINVFGKRAKPQHREGKGGSKYRELSGNQRFLLLHLLTWRAFTLKIALEELQALESGHTCKNLIPMVVTRAMANSSKTMHSWCVESEKWVEIFFHHWTSEKIPFLYFFLQKSWISQTLGYVKKNFSYRHWISCTGSKVPFWQFFIFAKI